MEDEDLRNWQMVHSQVEEETRRTPDLVTATAPFLSTTICLLLAPATFSALMYI